MNKYFIAAFIVAWIASSLGHGEEEVILGENSCRVLIDAHDRAAIFSRNFIGGQSNRWPNGVVPYIMSANFTETQKGVIVDSMKHISERTCVQFIPRSNESNYVDIYTGESGCFANLGYNGARMRSVLHLQSNACVTNGVVIHQLLHILGFGHEQTRPDRDDFVQIIWKNIKTGFYSNFWKALGENEEAAIPNCGDVGIESYDNCHSGFRASTFGIAYDYGSIMHYGLNFFTNNGQNTIVLKKEASVNIPNTLGMSELDVSKTRAAYQCQAVTEEPEISTLEPKSSSTYEPSTYTVDPESTTYKPEPSTYIPTTMNCRDTWDQCESYTYLCGRNGFINRGCKKTCFNCECKNIIGDESCEVLSIYCPYDFYKKLCAKKCGSCQ